MPDRLLVHISRAPDRLDLLRRSLEPGIELTLGPELPTDPGYGVLVAGRPRREEITASPSLRVLAIPFAGLPKETRSLMRSFPGVAVHNLHHNAGPTAETAVALLLAAAKFVLPMDRDLRAGDWSQRYGPSRIVVLEGKRALILGYGAVGKRVAAICRGFGLRVTAVRRTTADSGNQSPDEVHAIESLHELLPAADVVIVCLPFTDETEGVVGERELALLPESALLVNVGRGPIVDEAALYDSLKNGKLRAAGLDVWYNYPTDEASRSNTPPSNFPFHELDNVVMSPHRAGSPGSEETETLRMNGVALLLNRVLRGEPLPHRVDIDRGY